MKKRFFRDKSEASAYFEDWAVNELRQWHVDYNALPHWEETLFQLEHGLAHTCQNPFETAKKTYAKISNLKNALEGIGIDEAWVLTCADFYLEGEFETPWAHPFDTAGARVEYLSWIYRFIELCNGVEKMKKEALSSRPPSPYRSMACSLATHMQQRLNIVPTTSATGAFGRLLDLVLKVVEPNYQSDPKSVRQFAVKYVQSNLKN